MSLKVDMNYFVKSIKKQKGQTLKNGFAPIEKNDIKGS